MMSPQAKSVTVVGVAVCNISSFWHDEYENIVLYRNIHVIKSFSIADSYRCIKTAAVTGCMLLIIFYYAYSRLCIGYILFPLLLI